MLEEIYVYFEMPESAYGIQLVYNDTVPGHRIAFLWAMAAHREVEDRHWGVVNVQPEFQPSPPPSPAN